MKMRTENYVGGWEKGDSPRWRGRGERKKVTV